MSASFRVLPAVVLFMALVTPPAAGTEATQVKVSVDCAGLTSAFEKANAETRDKLAPEIVDAACRPMPAALWEAIQRGRWGEASTDLAVSNRIALLAAAARRGYPEAESLVVVILERGQWPSTHTLAVADAEALIGSLNGRLSGYSIGLLLDIYDQVRGESTRLAVLGALDGAKNDDALLPALDAYFLFPVSEPLRARAKDTLLRDPEGDPVKVLARVIRNVRPSALPWALRIALGQTSPLVTAARMERAAKDKP